MPLPCQGHSVLLPSKLSQPLACLRYAELWEYLGWQPWNNDHSTATAFIQLRTRSSSGLCTGLRRPLSGKQQPVWQRPTAW